MVVLDDMAIVREGVRQVLSEAPHLTLVGAAAPDDAGLGLVAAQQPDVVVADVRGGERPDLDLVRAIGMRQPGTRVVLFTDRADQDLLWEALEAGVRGYVLKDAPPEALVRALQQVVAGESWVDERLAPDVLRQLHRPRAGGVLSEREREILQMLADGASNRDVSERLVVSVETVKTHVKHILSKLEAKHRTQAVAIGLRRNLIR
ncbi:MAG: response regulator transcription factor [Actinomycetota bacterium]